MKLRMKLSLTFIITILLALLALGGLSFLKTQSIFSEEIQEVTESLVDEMSGNISKDMETYRHALSVMRINESLQKAYYERDTRMLMHELTNYREEFDKVTSVYAGYKNKEFYVYPDTELPDGFDPTSRPWYQEAAESGDIIWTDPYINTADQSITTSVAVPIYGRDDTLIGVLAADINVGSLAQEMNAIQVLESGYPYILDRQGNILTHKDSALVGQEVPVAEIQEAITQSSSGTVNYRYNNMNRFGIYREIQETGWTVIVGIDNADFFNKALPILMQILIIGLITFAIVIVISAVFSRMITKPVEKLQNVMNTVKEGDFSARVQIKGKDEIAHMAKAFNAMLDNVSHLVSETKHASESVSSASEGLSKDAETALMSAEEVSKTVQEIALGASDQAKDSEMGVIKANELNTSLDQLLTYIQEMTDKADNVKEQNEKSNTVIKTLRERSIESDSAILRIEDAVNNLDSKSHTIGTIVGTIYSIADQTNLLALNASIEAARAGEHGRGFAVVAEEIRKLSEESANAVKEIQQHIQEIQDQSSQTTEIMSVVKESGDLQNTSVKEVEASFQVIFSVIEDITRMIEQATNKVNEISAKKEEVVGSIENISAVSEETAAASEEVTASMEVQAETVRSVSSSSEELRALSGKLEDLLKRFKTE
jgi:methyl-accepting chemotaxis protein